MKKPHPLKGRPSPLKGKGRGVTWIRAHLEHQGEECLIYPYHKDDHGYGVAGYCGKLYRASRLMCIFKHGPPPSDEHQAAHSCGNGHLACTHPGHIFWRTPFENRMESNEHGTGNQPAPRRLTLDQVAEIRASSKPYAELAEEYGVHRDTIGKIFRGETWVSPRSLLTREQIGKLRALEGTMTIKAMAAEVGVEYSVAHRFFNRRTFSNVEP